MSRSVADFLILLFIYTIDGTPLGDKPESREMKYGYQQYYKSAPSGDGNVTFHWPKGVVQYFFDSSSYEFDGNLVKYFANENETTFICMEIEDRSVMRTLKRRGEGEIDDMLKDKLRIPMKSLEQDSCIRFEEMDTKPEESRSSWLHFTNPKQERGCFHTPTPLKSGEVQVILGYDCLKQQEIMHALLHGIGFRDEVTHPKRDSYVMILWNNIHPDHWKLFGKYATDDPDLLAEYDPKSIMHFHDHAFSINGQPTISALTPGLKIAPSENLSHLDKMKLNLKFGHECNKRKVGELLDTCQDLLSKDKAGSTNEEEGTTEEGTTQEVTTEEESTRKGYYTVIDSLHPHDVITKWIDTIYNIDR